MPSISGCASWTREIEWQTPEEKSYLVIVLANFGRKLIFQGRGCGSIVNLAYLCISLARRVIWQMGKHCTHNDQKPIFLDIIPYRRVNIGSTRIVLDWLIPQTASNAPLHQRTRSILCSIFSDSGLKERGLTPPSLIYNYRAHNLVSKLERCRKTPKTGSCSESAAGVRLNRAGVN